MVNRAVLVRWWVRVVTWDGALPIAIWLAPFGIGALFPNNRSAIELTAVVLPIVGFFVRFQAGRRQILSNECGPLARHFQLAMFCLGLLVMTLIDAVMVLSHVMPKGEAFVTVSDAIVWASLYLIYVTAMCVAMYPGTERRPGAR